MISVQYCNQSPMSYNFYSYLLCLVVHDFIYRLSQQQYSEILDNAQLLKRHDQANKSLQKRLEPDINNKKAWDTLTCASHANSYKFSGIIILPLQLPSHVSAFHVSTFRVFVHVYSYWKPSMSAPQFSAASSLREFPV